MAARYTVRGVGQPRRARLRVGVAGVVLAFAASACTGGGADTQPPAGGSVARPASVSSTAVLTDRSSLAVQDEPTPGAMGVTTVPVESTPRELDADTARDVLLAASLLDPATLDEVDALKADPAVVSAAEQLAPSVSSDGPRWAVVYVLANATGTVPSLAPFLSDDDITIRLLASIGAIGQGDRTGFPVLIEALAHDEKLAGFEPPMSAWATASMALARHTGLTLGPALDADPADRRASLERWQAWWADHADSVEFDVTTEEWSSP